MVNGSVKTNTGTVRMQALEDISLTTNSLSADDADGIITAGGSINLKSKTKINSVASFAVNSAPGSGSYTKNENPAGSINLATAAVAGGNITLTTDPSLTIPFGPGAPEICNGIDDNCDDSVYEGLAEEYLGDLAFTSQAELNAFPKCFAIINGSVTVAGADITSLAGLGNITEINGSFRIQNNPILVSLNGLEALTAIVGNFTINNNTILTDLSGINHRMLISLSLIISNNPVLGTCAVESICKYLSKPVPARMGRTLAINISNNAVGCMSAGEVRAAWVALPVTLVSFNAQKSEETVLLQWKTTEEENSADFDIQKSDDGKNWSSIGSVKSAGNTASEVSYEFIDRAPLKGTNL